MDQGLGRGERWHTHTLTTPVGSPPTSDHQRSAPESATRDVACTRGRIGSVTARARDRVGSVSRARPWDPKPAADGIGVGRARFIEHGLGAEFCLFGLDGRDDVETVVTAALCAQSWECVVIGGGVRRQVELLEQVINLVRRHAPDAAIAFNATPEETFDAAARWVEIHE